MHGWEEGENSAVGVGEGGGGSNSGGHSPLQKHRSSLPVNTTRSSIVNASRRVSARHKAVNSNTKSKLEALRRYTKSKISTLDEGDDKVEKSTRTGISDTTTSEKKEAAWQDNLSIKIDNGSPKDEISGRIKDSVNNYSGGDNDNRNDNNREKEKDVDDNKKDGERGRTRLLSDDGGDFTFFS